jgi:hypothetical protein
MGEQSKQMVQYFPFSSVIDIGFWHLLANKKLDVFQLDDRPIDIKASFRNGIHFSFQSYLLIHFSLKDSSHNLPPLLNLNYDSFKE